MLQPTLLIIGGSGFIGSAIAEHFTQLGFHIRITTRNIEPRSFPCEQIIWNGQELPTEALNNIHAVINLAGHPVAQQRWTDQEKERILQSRLQTTQALVNAIAVSTHKPNVVIQASAVGFFSGLPHTQPCNEQSQPGHDFLAQVCQAWEQTALPLQQHTRLCIARLGVVLGWEGGALPTLWNLYASGVGSTLGHAQQYMNAISLLGVVRFCEYAIQHETLQGIFHLVAPNNDTQKTCHALLARETPSASFMHTPAFALKLALGERATLMLSGPNVQTPALLQHGFQFQHKNLESMLTALMQERVHRNAHYFKVKLFIPKPPHELWDFFASPHNLEAITPPWLNFKIKQISTPNIQQDTRITYSLRIHGVPATWKTHIQQWDPPHQFVDTQEKGPYHLWHHQHVFTPLAHGTCMQDRVEYQLPLFPLSQVALGLVQQDVHKIFAFRKQAMNSLFRLTP